jgi:hypothetical protein
MLSVAAWGIEPGALWMRLGVLVFLRPPRNPAFQMSQPYTHAVIRFNGRPELELHIGIKVAGTSGVLHECDVALLNRDEAHSCRRETVHPRCAAVILAAECKFYASVLPLNLGRSFLGLTGEIHKEGRYFVTNSGSPNIERLLRHHKVEWDVGVLPGREEALGLIHNLRRRLRKYKVA